MSQELAKLWGFPETPSIVLKLPLIIAVSTPSSIKNHRRPNVINRVGGAVETAVVDFAVEQPVLGQVQASNELRKRRVRLS